MPSCQGNVGLYVDAISLQVNPSFCLDALRCVPAMGGSLCCDEGRRLYLLYSPRTAPTIDRRAAACMTDNLAPHAAPEVRNNSTPVL